MRRPTTGAGWTTKGSGDGDAAIGLHFPCFATLVFDQPAIGEPAEHCNTMPVCSDISHSRPTASLLSSELEDLLAGVEDSALDKQIEKRAEPPLTGVVGALASEVRS